MVTGSSLVFIDNTFDPKYNDLPLIYDEDIFKTLSENGMYGHEYALTGVFI